MLREKHNKREAIKSERTWVQLSSEVEKGNDCLLAMLSHSLYALVALTGLHSWNALIDDGRPTPEVVGRRGGNLGPSVPLKTKQQNAGDTRRICRGHMSLTVISKLKSKTVSIEGGEWCCRWHCSKRDLMSIMQCSSSLVINNCCIQTGIYNPAGRRKNY